MLIMRTARLVALLGAFGLLSSATAAPLDSRNISHGTVVPDEGYCDQPYVVITKDGNWLCTLTTGQGVEGQRGQHVCATISTDKGKTWSPLIDIEPADGPEASWVMPLIVPSGRVYAFYTYNAANLRLVPNTNSPGVAKRVDTLGQYVFKYSDDHGRTWSKQRYDIPMRRMRIDREDNQTGGETLFFWGVGKPVVDLERGRMVFGFAKVGKWGLPGAMVSSQGCFIRSDNVLTEPDPAKLRFELLPDGDEGLRAPKGPVSDEANPVVLADGSLFATYRTIDGYPCHAYSRDGGHTWTPPEHMTYGPGRRKVKHPRAANFVKKFSNGKYLYWFHNHGGEPVHAAKWGPYDGRNPAWVLGGVEKDGLIHWSQPEVLLYDDDPKVRMSYPDFIEDDGRFYVTETQKTVARVHEIDPTLLDDLWTQHERKEVARHGLVIDVAGGPIAPGSRLSLPKLPDLKERGGFTIDFWARFGELTAGQVLVDARDANGRGFALTTTERSTLELVLNDGANEARWDCDPGTHEGTLRANAWQHVAVIVDAGPRLILFVVDGVLDDGGAVREYGWGRFPPELGDLNGPSWVVLAPKLLGQLGAFRLYDRPLRVSEAVGNARAGRTQP